jgi:hypothetical protein
MSIVAAAWAVLMLVVALALAVPLLVILLVSVRTRPAIVSAVKFVGWAIGAVVLLVLLGYFVAAPASHSPRQAEVRNVAPSDAAHGSITTPAPGSPADFAPVSVSNVKPEWVDRAPGMRDQAYQVAVKSGLWTTQAECQRAIEGAIRKSLDEYLTNYFGDERAARLVDVDPAYLHQHLIKQPLYAETVDASVGTMQQLHALLEFDDELRAEMHRLWRQAFVSHRLRYAGAGFALVLGALAAVCGYLKLDLATGGLYTRRLRWGSALAILLVAAGAVGVCVF